MSEQDSNKPSSSDVLFGARKPTVIKEQIVYTSYLPTPQKFGPTVIGGNQTQEKSEENNVNKQKLKPTVIGGGNMNNQPAVSRPTATIPPNQKVRPMEIKTPSVIPGTVRKGLVVSTTDLGKFFPGTSPDTLTKIEMILKNTIVETLNTVSCSQWGSKTQVRYTELVNESLKLTSARFVQESIRHNIRLYQLLEEISASFQNKNTKGFKFWKNEQLHHTAWQKFQSVQNEINQLRENLADSLPKLRNTQFSLDEISLEFQKLVVELDAYSVSANYIADHLGTRDSRSGHLLDQSISLTKMIAQIQEGVILRRATVQEIDAIADRIQESVLVTLPAWIEKASLVLQHASTNETEQYTIRQSLEEIIQNIR